MEANTTYEFQKLTPEQVGVIDAMGDRYFTTENIQFWLGITDSGEDYHISYAAAVIDGYLEAVSEVVKNKDAVVRYLQTL